MSRDSPLGLTILAQGTWKATARKARKSPAVGTVPLGGSGTDRDKGKDKRGRHRDFEKS